jgi:hypothetical protein
MKRRKKLTVGELKAAINGVPDDAFVVIAIDPEGNAYRPIDAEGGVMLGQNYNEDTYETGYDPEVIDDATKKALGITDEEMMPDGDPCIVLWPL